MRWQETQERFERLVYEAIDDLEDQLNIELSCLPEVWWVGRTIDFDGFSLPLDLKEELETSVANKVSRYIISENAVVIVTLRNSDAFLEEASHAFHFLASGISYKGRNKKDELALSVLVELIGFLGSRLLGWDRDNPYEEFPDISLLDKKSREKIGEQFAKRFYGEFDPENFFIYQQGYGLANQIYYQYLSGKISIAWIRKLFLNKFEGKNGAIKAYLKLKKRFWPKDLKQVA